MKWLHAPPPALIYATGTTSIATGTTPTVLPLDTASYDTDSMTGTTGKLICRTAGVYAISASLAWEHAGLSSAGIVWAYSAIAVNGSPYIRDSRIIGGLTIGTPPYDMVVPLAFELQLAVSDYVQLVATPSYGFALNVVAMTNVAPRLSLHRVST